MGEAERLWWAAAAGYASDGRQYDSTSLRRVVTYETPPDAIRGATSLPTRDIQTRQCIYYLLHRRPFAYHLLGDSRAATPAAIKPFLISYILFWLLALLTMTLYLYFHFVSSSQASDNMSSLFSIFSSPQNRHNIQYPNKRWLAKIYIWALWTGKNKCRTAVNYSQWPKRTRILASNFLVRIHSSIQRQLLCNILYYTTKATRILRNLKRSSQLGRAPILAFILSKAMSLNQLATGILLMFQSYSIPAAARSSYEFIISIAGRKKSK